MTQTPVYSLDSWPEGVSPFSRRVRNLVNTMGTTINWVRANRARLEWLIIKPEPPPPARPRPLYVLISGSGSPFAPNRFDYSWNEVRFDAAARTFGVFTGSRSSTDANETTALNLAEFKNTAAVAAHGVVLNSPEASGNVEQIPIGTPVTLTLAGSLDVGGTITNFRVFSEVNAINFGCNAPLLPPFTE